MKFIAVRGSWMQKEVDADVDADKNESSFQRKLESILIFAPS